MKSWINAGLALMAFLTFATGSIAANTVTNMVATPVSPANLSADEEIHFTFDYETDDFSGVRIFIRAFEWEGAVPSETSHASPLYLVGTGTGTGWFRVTAGPSLLTRIRVQMLDSAQTLVLFEEFIDVAYSIGVVGEEPVTFSMVKTLYR